MPPMPDIEGYARLFYYFVVNFFNHFFFVDTAFLWFTFFILIYLTNIFYVFGQFYTFFNSGWFPLWFICMVHYHRTYFYWCNKVLWKRFEGDYPYYWFFLFFYFFIFFYYFYFWFVFSIIFFFQNSMFCSIFILTKICFFLVHYIRKMIFFFSSFEHYFFFNCIYIFNYLSFLHN